ncbi:response regulator transcription factor [Ruminococcus sp.]|uniref:response regulator transcription factor n=1 Tax=Ruminococcus sp. TaxID=41978 RepID=UPI0025D6934F|nr:response regulator transcription factor [Ruminococcus sp.]MBQ8965667.1 response regulator transcription factor [Ruminococcus sp.]
MSRIFIAEDDSAILAGLTDLLSGAGYETAVLNGFENAPAQILAARPDLVLMDITLPVMNGEMILREIRKSSDVPVIMVTSRSSETDEVLSLSYGADDYVSKPYDPTILLLRISAVLKRYSRVEEKSTYRGLNLNTARGSLSDGSTELVLTKNEMLIFRVLLDKQGQIVTRDELMTALWDNEEYINDNALTVNISRLRQKLDGFGCKGAIETRKKQGYILL